VPATPSRQQARRRRLAALGAIALVAVVVAFVVVSGGSESKRLVPGGGERSGTYDPLAYSPDREQDLVRRAAAGFSDVVWEKSPGGVVASARRTARWRPLIESAARANGLDPDSLEAIVYLESAGRPDAIAGGNLEGAVGLTQILASTATQLLQMKVDLAHSRSLTHRIAAATSAKKAQRLQRARRRFDQRFDPAHSIEGAARYLALARRKFGREDLAIASYHMGMGNLENVLSRYAAQGGASRPSYARLYFDTAPLRKPRAYQLLSSFGDDSSTYLWRVLAAREIMRLYRDDPLRLSRLAALDRSGGAGARRLYPNGAPATSVRLTRPPAYGPALGLRFSPAARSDFAPTPATLATLVYIGAGTRRISGRAPLIVTGAHGVSLEIARHYRGRRQALAFQYMLDRLQAANLIAWGRGDTTIAIAVGADAGKLLPPASRLARDARR
jgi:soluble lytic murein transglycosylase-like protein